MRPVLSDPRNLQTVINIHHSVTVFNMEPSRRTSRRTTMARAPTFYTAVSGFHEFFLLNLSIHFSYVHWHYSKVSREEAPSLRRGKKLKSVLEALFCARKKNPCFIEPEQSRKLSSTRNSALSTICMRCLLYEGLLIRDT